MAKLPKKMPLRRAYAALDALIDFEGEVGDALVETGSSRNALSDVADALRKIIETRQEESQ